jgi:preprotein translocase subunit SecG
LVAVVPLDPEGKEVAVPVPEMVLLGDTLIPFVLNLLIIIVGLFLIGIVLLQRGKGGGLAGAFGGVGGSSAFGSRAGDQFTRVTLIVALIWVFLIMFMTKTMPRPRESSGGPAFNPPPVEEGRLWVPEGPPIPPDGHA